MAKSKPLVMIGMLGATLDRGSGPRRWDAWRPTVSLFGHEDLVVDRLELLHQRRFKKVADQVVADVATLSPETEVRTPRIEFKDPWDFEEVYGALRDFADSYDFDTEREDYLIHVTTGTHVVQICLYLLTEARYLPARLIQSSPPNARSKRSPGQYTIIDLDLSKYDKIASRFARKTSEDLDFLKAGIPTRNADFNHLIEMIERIALVSDAPILLSGRTGVGKSQLARRIFELKKRHRRLDAGLVEVNCATLRGDGAMSALFGHQKGAFTGALGARKGLLLAADRGLLFLDEIGELGLDEQAMLLRALEEKQFLPMGSDKEVGSDFQLIAGTNRDLAQEVQKGTFREDLLARINLWNFELPALKDRREDVSPNLDFELLEAERRHGHRVSFNKEARDKFLHFAESAPWPGNFRDFRAAVERLATLASPDRITAALVDMEIKRLHAAWRPTEASRQETAYVEEALGLMAAEVDPFDRAQLEEVLRTCRTSTNLSDAGRRLFSVSRTKKKSNNDADRIRKYLAKFGLAWSELPR